MVIRSIGKIRKNFRDSYLSEEEYRKLETTAVKALRKKVLFRKLFPSAFKTSIGWKTEYKYDKMTDIGDAEIDSIFRSLQIDISDKTRSTLYVRKIERDFYVPRWKYEAALEEGRNLVNEAVEMASYKVALKEDDFILLGWAEDGTNFDETGLYHGAGNDYATAKAFGTFGEAKDAVSGSIALCQADDFFGPYFLFVNPIQGRGLRGSYSTTGEPELPIVNNLLNDPSFGKLGENDGATRRIFAFPRLTAGKGLLLSEDNAENNPWFVIPGVPLTVETYDKETKDGVAIAGRVFETLLFGYAFSNVGCKMSNLS